jgi:heme A synthase
MRSTTLTPPHGSSRSRRRLRARWYAIGAVAVLAVAWVLGALSARSGDPDGAVLSGFLAAIWSFATYVVLVNVVELTLLLRASGQRRAATREEGSRR